MRVLLFVAGFALLAGPALAQNAAPTDTPQNPDDVVTCVHSNPPLGSRGGWHDECHTRAQWKALEGYYSRSNRDFSDMNSRSGASNGAPGH